MLPETIPTILCRVVKEYSLHVTSDYNPKLRKYLSLMVDGQTAAENEHWEAAEVVVPLV